MLLFLRPFRVGEYIDAEGISGTVDEIGLFTTHLTTYDGVYVETPNSNLWNRSVINYSRLREKLIGEAPDRSFGLRAHAWAVRGKVPFQ